MNMSPDAHEAGVRYAEHAHNCPVCQSSDYSLCEEGVKLMDDFHRALHADDLNRAENDS